MTTQSISDNQNQSNLIQYNSLQFKSVQISCKKILTCKKICASLTSIEGRNGFDRNDSNDKEIQVMKYGICEAKMQDEFPGFKFPDGKLVLGTITQLELSDSQESEVVAWFRDEALAEKVARLLNKKAK